MNFAAVKHGLAYLFVTFALVVSVGTYVRSADSSRDAQDTAILTLCHLIDARASHSRSAQKAAFGTIVADLNSLSPGHTFKALPSTVSPTVDCQQLLTKVKHEASDVHLRQSRTRNESR